MDTRLRDIAASLASPVERRLFAEYGAVFLTMATPPPTVIFPDSPSVEAFQSSLRTQRRRFGDYEMELQAAAMAALLTAADELAAQGLTLSARAADSGRRSYDETVSLWTRNVTRGLAHWLESGQEAEKLNAGRADMIRSLAPVEQVAVILELEEREAIYFGTFFDRSILCSVAAPGASQHLALLAFDVAEYKEAAVEATLNRCGWHRTVVHDLPHFTYLGYATDELPALGLREVKQEYGDFTCRYWVPNL